MELTLSPKQGLVSRIAAGRVMDFSHFGGKAFLRKHQPHVKSATTLGLSTFYHAQRLCKHSESNNCHIFLTALNWRHSCSLSGPQHAFRQRLRSAVITRHISITWFGGQQARTEFIEANLRSFSYGDGAFGGISWQTQTQYIWQSATSATSGSPAKFK